MTRPLTIRAIGALDIAHAVAIASLPASLRLTDDIGADIMVVSPEDAAIAAGLDARPRALVVTRPGKLGASAAVALEQTDVPVFAGLTLVPGLQALDAREALSGAGIVRSRLAWAGSGGEGMFEHLCGLAALLGPLSEVRMLSSGPNGHAGSAKTEHDVMISWSGQGDAPVSEFELDIIGASTRLEVRGLIDGSARPLQVCLAGVDGQRQGHGIFETGQRQFWRGVVDAFNGGSPAPQWSRFASLLAVTRRADAALAA